mgnify:CR=1 FL=1
MIKVIPVPAFQDNYLWLFHTEGSNQAYVVDPGDANPVQKVLEEKGLQLAGILITHHHWDHIGGIDQLLALSDVPVYGPESPNIHQITHPLRQGDTLNLSEELQFQVLEVPGHTLDHVAYFCPSSSQPLLFCGDTLFAGGCGRLFEGSAEQMHRSLSKLAALPAATAVYCAHEYTLSNLAFARVVEANNAELIERIAREEHKRSLQQPTVPSTIGLELATNPFLRCTESSVKGSVQVREGRQFDNPADVLAAVRRWKDNF